MGRKAIEKHCLSLNKIRTYSLLTAQSGDTRELCAEKGILRCAETDLMVACG